MAQDDSFPLMNLSQKYNVDYIIVLLWADYLRHDRCKLAYPTHRYSELAEMLQGVHSRIGHMQYTLLLGEIAAHANERWGSGPMIFCPFITVDDQDAA